MNKQHKDRMTIFIQARATIAEGRLLREMMDKSANGDAKGLKDAVDGEFTNWTEIISRFQTSTAGSSSSQRVHRWEGHATIIVVSCVS